MRVQQGRPDLRLRGLLRLEQGPRVPQHPEEELHLPAGLLRGPQAQTENIKHSTFYCQVHFQKISVIGFNPPCIILG